MIKKVLSVFLLGLVIGLFTVQAGFAYDPDFDAKQKQAMKDLGLTPGERINADNWQKIKDCLPPSVVEWVKKGEFTIFPDYLKYDYSNDEAYEKLCMLNKGKYGIGNRGQVIVKSTGKDPDYVQGRPFPVIDPNDPQAGVKILHNRDIDKMRTGCSALDWDVCWISDTTGLDRYIAGVNRGFYQWNRPDGSIPNPQKVKRFELTTVDEPFDLAGAAMLYHYWLDGTPERFVQYIPALRRIKKMNVTDRSSPFFGTDFCNDDSYGYSGQPESMDWKVIDKKELLMPMADWVIDQPDMYEQLPDGGWKAGPAGELTWGYEDQYKNEKYNVQWMPWFVKWIPREMWVISVKAKDPYYAYGDQIVYVDVASRTIIYKVVWDKSGAYWKTLVACNDPEQWGKNRSVTMSIFYINVDDKTHHASISNCRGKRGNLSFDTILNSPKNNPRIYKDEYISTMSR